MKNIENLDPLSKIESIAKDVDNVQKHRTQNAFNRYPITFSLLSIVGLSAIIYSVEIIILIN